jgi:hypothetical protein
LKAPGRNRLKLKHERLLLTFAFKFNLRRYNLALCRECAGNARMTRCPVCRAAIRTKERVFM